MRPHAAGPVRSNPRPSSRASSARRRIIPAGARSLGLLVHAINPNLNVPKLVLRPALRRYVTKDVFMSNFRNDQFRRGSHSLWVADVEASTAR